MSLFQIIVLPILVILLIERLLAAFRGRGPRRMALFWAALWLSACLIVAVPGVTDTVARFVGIGRGASLVVYLALLSMFVGFFMGYVRVRRLEADITRLVRHLAMQDPITPGKVRPPGGDEPPS